MPFVNRDGVRIHYEVEGEGPALVVLPGIGTSMIDAWPLVGGSGALPKRKVILVDPRGHGKSDKPRDPKAHKIEAYREDVRAVLDATGVERAVFWAFSDGANVGCAIAEAYPRRTVALISQDGILAADLCEPSVRDDRIETARTVRTRGWVAVVRDFAASQGVSDDSRVIKSFMAEDTEMVALELEQWVEWKGPMSVLPRLKLPLLLMHSADTPADLIARLTAAAGSLAQTNVIPGTNHFKICCELGRSLPLVRDFLDRVQP
ncbi:MAG: alpha/beta fold hydrolase [Thermoplasmata archaeon]|nr:alpha/beta hydrolase [Thermoplasmata archaeon]